MLSDNRKRYEKFWRGEGAILQIDVPQERRVSLQMPPEVEEVGWLLAYTAEQWVGKGEDPDWDWLCEAYRLSWQGTYLGQDGYRQIWINLGPGVLAAYLQGHAEFRGDTVWFELSQPLSWEEIAHLDYAPENPWWRFSLEAVQQLGMRGREEGVIIGTTDIGGVHDVLSSLRGAANIMTDFCDSPGELQKAADHVLSLWHRYYDELDKAISAYQDGRDAWMHIYSELPWYPIQCDLAYMLSPGMFEEFIAPVIASQCKRLDRTIYHLDGMPQLAHLDCLLDIPELSGIQWIPGAGNPSRGDPCWFPYYQRIQEKGKLLVIGGVEPELLEGLMNAISPAGVLLSASAQDIETARKVEDKFRRWSDSCRQGRPR